MNFGDQLREFLRKSPLFVGYLLLVMLLVIGFLYMESLTRKIDDQAVARSELQCRAGNDTRQVVASVLDALAAPRPDDVDGEFEARQHLRVELEPLLLPADCGDVLGPKGQEEEDP